MHRDPRPRLDVEALHLRLRERIAELHPPIVADVMRVFLEVSSMPCAAMLWSFEFAFDEDDDRIARLEARFAKKGARNPSEEDLAGYEVHVHLPKVIPAHPPPESIRAAARALETAPARGSLLARFLEALEDLGAYQTIEQLEARLVEVYLR